MPPRANTPLRIALSSPILSR
uniref:Uncharacterized protein n=1 Tax=Oryza barthii TaxID=65489 RepID=A0A0D3F655_9ORYZ